MTKKFVQIQSHQRKYKLNTTDIKNVYIINKKNTPRIPKFCHSLEHLKMKHQTEIDLNVYVGVHDFLKQDD